MQVTLYITIDLNQAVCGHVAPNLQSVANDCFTAPHSNIGFLLGV